MVIIAETAHCTRQIIAFSFLVVVIKQAAVDARVSHSGRIIFRLRTEGNELAYRGRKPQRDSGSLECDDFISAL